MGNALRNIKDFFSVNEEYDDSYDDVDDFEEETQEKKSLFGRSSKNNVVSINPHLHMKVVLYEPVEYEDSTVVVDDLKQGKTVVVNLIRVDNDIKNKIFYFLTGAIYSLEGHLHKIETDIFILAPNAVEVEGVKEALKSKRFFL